MSAPFSWYILYFQNCKQLKAGETIPLLKTADMNQRAKPQRACLKSRVKLILRPLKDQKQVILQISYLPPSDTKMFILKLLVYNIDEFNYCC